MRCMERIGEVKELFGGGMKRLSRQFQERKMHTNHCVRVILRRIRGGMKGGMKGEV